MPTPELLEFLTQFGVAGLMGLLWVWERTLSRRRERQLDEAHTLLRDDRKAIVLLIDLVAQNKAALERFEYTQVRLHSALEALHPYAHNRPHAQAAHPPQNSPASKREAG